MIQPNPFKTATGFVGDVAGDVFRDVGGNLSQGQPVSLEGAFDSAKSSASSRVGQAVPEVLRPALTRGVRKALNDTSTKNTTTSNQTKTNTKSQSGQKGRSPGKGGKGGRGPRRYAGGQQQSPQSVQTNTSAYGNIEEGSLFTIDSEKDTSYWADVLQNQQIEDGVKNTSRTSITLIRTDHNAVLRPGDNLKLKTAYSSIYMQKLNECIGTTGGNASIKTAFTEANFWQHQRYAYSACLKLAEIYTIRAWNPPYDETNTVIREFKNALCSNVNLMNATNRLEEAVAQYALPYEAIKYALSIFQTYKKSPVSGGVHWRFMSQELSEDFKSTEEVFTTTVSGMDTLSALMTDSTWTLTNGTLTSLLLHKCNGFSSCRTRKVGAQYPAYQMDMNAISDNMKYMFHYDGGDWFSDSPTEESSILVAFPFDVDNVPKHVSASLAMRWLIFADTDTGYPWFSQFNDSTSSRYTCLNNDTQPFNVSWMGVNQESRDVSDNNYSIASSNEAAYFKPIGLNTQLFQPTQQVVVNSVRDTLYNVYSMPSMS